MRTDFFVLPPSLSPIDQLAVCELALSSLFSLAGCVGIDMRDRCNCFCF